MFGADNIFETNRMIAENKLDVRTITMGISLRDCAHPDLKVFCTNVYDKITKMAEHLVTVGKDIEATYGVPIVNRRIAITPIAIAADACKTDSYVPIAEVLESAAKAIGIDFIGGFSALIEGGCTRGDATLLASIPEAMAKTERVCSSVGIGSTKAGLNMNAVRKMGEIIKQTAALTADRDAVGCAKLVVFCNTVENNPFMAGAFHGITQGDCAIHVGVSGPGVVKRALESVRGESFDVVAETIKRTAFKITRVGQLVAQEAARRLGAPLGIIDLSLAPTSEMGDSVAYILEEMGLESCGAPGTTAALALLNDAVKKGGLMAAMHVGGLSGAFIPVSEDIGMIEAVQRGSLSLEKLEAMTCVCSVGLDMIAIPGDTTAATISGIIADEAAIGMINNKTTAVRVIPVPGKKVGDQAVFGGLLGYAPIIAVNTFGQSDFIARGGHIPAPVRSLTN
ncbi:MAG: PFL family protein [Alphaproteobacteria bacterium]|nr:PFL family protein [Alphaproteobacteria bacterium]